MEIKCNDCKVEFQVTSIISKVNDSTLYGRGFKKICCESCGSFNIVRINEVTEGYPNLGKYSATNDTNRKKK